MADSLRSGFTTGAAMTAGALAVLSARNGRVLDAAELLLPDGSMLSVPVAHSDVLRAMVIKDAGDDPDATDKAHIVVELRPAERTELEPADFQEACGDAVLMIRGGEGIGRATRPGLAVPVGKWAVNPGPRRLLVKNLFRAGLVSGTWLLTVSIENGEKIAEKTLNPTLGISGGLSILGGGGIVKPFSNAAYTSAIALQMRTIAASGKECVALVTGNRTESAVLRDNPFLEPMQVVRIADFIAFSIRAAKAAGLKKVLVACMPGKLFKYACGEENTHAHNTKLRPERLRSMGLRYLPALPLETFDTMGELAAHLDESTFRNLLGELHVLAEKQLAAWSGESMTLELLLYNDKGERIL